MCQHNLCPFRRTWLINCQGSVSWFLLGVYRVLHASNYCTMVLVKCSSSLLSARILLALHGLQIEHVRQRNNLAVEDPSLEPSDLSPLPSLSMPFPFTFTLNSVFDWRIIALQCCVGFCHFSNLVASFIKVLHVLSDGVSLSLPFLFGSNPMAQAKFLKDKIIRINYM